MLLVGRAAVKFKHTHTFHMLRSKHNTYVKSILINTDAGEEAALRIL